MVHPAEDPVERLLVRPGVPQILEVVQADPHAIRGGAVEREPPDRDAAVPRRSVRLPAERQRLRDGHAVSAAGMLTVRGKDRDRTVRPRVAGRRRGEGRQSVGMNAVVIRQQDVHDDVLAADSAVAHRAARRITL